MSDQRHKPRSGTITLLLKEIVPPWITACAFFTVMGDFNAYVVFPEGRVMMQHVASFEERLIWSVVLAVVFAAVHSALKFVWGTLLDRLNRV